MRFFFFGSLMDRDVAELVLGRRVDPGALRVGLLHGYERRVVAEETYPALAPRAGGKVAGLVLDEVDSADLARMQFLESDEFVPAPCEIELASGDYISAHTFVAREVLKYTDQPWDFTRWQREDKQDYLRLVREWMSEYGRREAHELEAAWSEARRQQARDDKAPCEQRQTNRRGKSHD